MKIAVCTLAIGEEFKEAVFPAQYSKELYCKKHGYSLIDDESVYDRSRPIAWSKILLLEKYLPQYDYVVWIDADAMIMNLEHKLEDKIEKIMEGRDVMVLKPYPRINTGVIFLKNTSSNMQLLRRIYESTEFLDESKYGDWEQDAFINIVETDENVRNRVKICSYEHEPEIQSYWFVYHVGHFILHLCGYRGNVKSLKYDLRRFCMVKLPDETEETYNERVEWMKNEYRKYVDKRMGRA